MLIAHASHWLVTASYLAPVAGFLVWLGVVTLRQRREDRAEREPPDTAGSGA
ncbi:MAG: hypothetical protein WKF96_18555 [Solirubrobacteraceae bacterium]